MQTKDHQLCDGDLGGPSGAEHEETFKGLRGPMTISKAKKPMEALGHKK